MDNLGCRVLLVEDNEDDYLIVRDLLLDIETTDYDLQWVDDYQAARESLARHGYDVCLLDYRLGEATGVELVREFAHRGTPFILLTGNEDYEVDVAAARAGASDYLLKGHINAPLLERAIRYAIERKKTEAALQQTRNIAQATADSLKVSERSYRRLFEAAQDGILILDAASGRIKDVNPYLCELLGYSSKDFVGRRLWEIGAFRDIAASQEAFRTLQEQRYIRFEDLPLETEDGRSIAVEFVSNVYEENGRQVIQCNIRNITERKQAEQQLRMHSHLLNVIGQAVVVTDAGGIITYWNDFAEKLYGWTAEEVLGRDILEVTPTDTSQQQAEEVMSCLMQGKSWSGEFVAQKRDGTRFPAYVTDTPILDEDGRVSSIIGLSLDISERKRAENALRESQERFQIIVSNVPGMVYQFVLQPDGSIEWPFVSQGCREIYGVEPQVLVDDPEVTVRKILSEDRGEFDRLVLASAQSLAPFRWEGRHRHPSGKIKWVQAASRPQRLPNGGTLWNGVVMDITARREAEEERDRFFTLSPDMMGIVGVDGYFKRVNPAFEATLGYQSAHITSRHYLELVHPDDRRATKAQAEALVRGSRMVGYEDRYSCSDGSYKWLRWTGVRFEDLLYVVGHDVTQVKEAEAALLRANDVLEERVEERTAELEQSNATLHLEILERERAEREVRAQARQHESVADLGRRALLDLDLDTLLEEAVDMIAATLDVEICSFWGRNPDSDTLRLRCGVDANQEGGAQRQALDMRIGEDSQIGYASLRNEPILSEDIEHETRFAPTPYLVARNISSTITVPVHDGELYGVLAACSPHKQKFGQSEIFFLQAIANVLSSAIARKMALDALQQTAEAFRSTQEMLQLVINHIPQAIFWKDRELRYMGCNDRMALDAGYASPVEILGKSDFDLPWANRASDYRADDAQVMDTNTAKLNFEELLTRGDGSHIWLRTSKVPLHDNSGEVVGVLASYEDITQQKEAEAAMHQAREEAEQANRAKSEFLSRMSHELRTPLNAILGFGQILEMRTSEPKQRGNIEQILKAGRHLLGLINEVLDIARIEAGHLSLSLEPVPVGNVVREILDLVRPLAATRSISLENEVGGEDAGRHLLADQQRLKQVLLNLLSNAVKYNRDGGSVFISCQVFPPSDDSQDSNLKATSSGLCDSGLSDSGLCDSGIVIVEAVQVSEDSGGPSLQLQHEGRLRILVCDTGGGLSEDDISRLFVPFERLGAARTQIEGTGIGLTLCKRLVQAMHGEVGVQSQVGQGSTFWVELPLVSSPLELAEELEAELGDSPDVDDCAPIQGTILYIEDNLSNISLVEHALSSQCYRVKLLTAMQGSVGLELAAQHIPDLILLDVHLPDILGDVVLRHLKANEATQDIPVVVLSADATPSQIERLLAGGAQDYLTKPLDLKNFFRVVEQVLEKPEPPEPQAHTGEEAK